MRIVSGIITVVCLAGLLFFSLRPAPMHAGRTAGLPKPIARWLNGNDQLANFLAFAGLGTMGALATRRRRHRPQSGFADRGKILVALGLLAMALELAQLMIPGRVCDLKDMIAAWAGLLLVWAVSLFSRGQRA